jgi:hypothetical protein
MEVSIRGSMHSIHFSSNCVYFLPEIILRSTIEDTSCNPFSAVAAIPSICVFASYLEPSTIYDTNCVGSILNFLPSPTLVSLV